MAVKDKALTNIERDLNSRLDGIWNYAQAGAIVHVDDATTVLRPPAPAWYEPGTADVHIHLTEAGILDPRSMSPKQENTISGLLTHELAHSAWSHWLNMSLRASVDSAVWAVLEMFEEIRIETKAANYNRTFRGWLRASFDIIMRELTGDVPENGFAVAHMWGIAFGRVFAGVISEDEIVWVDNAARTLLTDDTVDALTDILQEAVALRDLDTSRHAQNRIVSLANEWIELVGRPAPGEGTPGGCGHAKPMDKDEDESEAGGKSVKTESADDKDDATKRPTGSGEDKDEDKDAGDDDSAADEAADEKTDKDDSLELSEKHADMSESVPSDEKPIADGDIMRDAMLSLVEEVADKWDVRAGLKLSDSTKQAAAVFGKTKMSARIRESKPTVELRQRVKSAAMELERLSLPAVSKRAVPSLTPPGRLRSREAVRASAERAQGRMVTARPWTTTRRRHEHVKPLVVGIATDTSGSMRWAEEAVADFAYVWANAGHHVGARTASVTFGSYVDAVTRPGELPTTVRRVPADGGVEEFDKAISALDGVLHFSSPNNVSKLLIIVSDGELVIDKEPQRAAEWLERFIAGGSSVVWITPGSGAKLFRHISDKVVVKVLDHAARTSWYSPDKSDKSKSASVLVHEAALEAVRMLARKEN